MSDDKAAPPVVAGEYDGLIERLRDRQVCSPTQNACRNDWRIEQAADALAAMQARVSEAGGWSNRFGQELDKARAAMPVQFILDPPDGGDVKLHEAVERVVDALAAMQARVRDSERNNADDTPIYDNEGHVVAYKDSAGNVGWVGRSNPAPYTCKHRCERDALKDEIFAAQARIAALTDIRQREVQALFAGLSRRDWHATETAANQMRDKIDRLLIARAALKGGE